MKKTTLYIDIEDDIAAIIEKLEASDQKIVAMVLPKRPSVLQGSVNLQLLKRAADSADKNLVLITQDEQVQQLAGELSMHVSTSLQSKPFIPKSALSSDPAIEEIVDQGPDPAQPDVYAGDKKVDLSTPVGELSGDVDSDEIELDNSDKDDVDDELPASENQTKKRIKVPNFGDFRTKLMAGGLLVAIIIAGLVWALMFAPKANIVIATERSDVEGKLTLTATTTASAVDKEKGLIPAVLKQDQQKLSGTFKATGQKDVGEKATGTMTIRNCDYSDGFTLPAGTRFTNSGKTFVSTEAVVVPQFSGSASSCTLSGSKSGKATVDVVAEQSGDTYNLSARSYSIASISSADEVDAVGSNMGGGTTKLVSIVTDSDIATAKSKVLESAAGNVEGKLTQLLSDEGLLAIQGTFKTSEDEPVSSVPVGQEAPTDPTITIQITSTMLGMKFSDVEPLMSEEVTKKIDTNTQKIYDSGVKSAVVSVLESSSPETFKLNIVAAAKVGPSLDQSLVANEIAGLRAGEAKQLLEARPGVKSVDIRLDPFWVFSIPKKTSKITVTINE